MLSFHDVKYWVRSAVFNALFACLLLLLFEGEDETSRLWLGHVKYEKVEYKSQAERAEDSRNHQYTTRWGNLKTKTDQVTCILH